MRRSTAIFTASLLMLMFVACDSTDGSSLYSPTPGQSSDFVWYERNLGYRSYSFQLPSDWDITKHEDEGLLVMKPASNRYVDYFEW